jgi:hypothetical protein
VDGEQIEALTERVNRIEKGRIIWKVVAFGSLLAAASPFVLKLPLHLGPPGNVTGTSFILVDGNGQALIRLGRHAEVGRAAALEFLDSGGRPRIVIAVNEADAAVVSLVDPITGDQLVLDVGPNRGSAISLRDGSSRSGLLLTTDKSGVAALGFMDKEGSPVVQLGVDPDGSGMFTLLSKDGRKLFEAPAAEKRKTKE